MNAALAILAIFAGCLAFSCGVIQAYAAALWLITIAGALGLGAMVRGLRS